MSKSQMSHWMMRMSGMTVKGMASGNRADEMEEMDEEVNEDGLPLISD